MSNKSLTNQPKANQTLFLFEVLVDNIIFLESPCITDKNFKTCISISLAGMGTLDITDNNISDISQSNPCIKHFNQGKSCLFSLQDAAITQAMTKCVVKTIVAKTLPCGCLPTRVVIGEAVIDMTKEFAQARTKFLNNPTACSYEALKDSFRLLNAEGVKVGEILMFLRITCFGKNIVTKFQGGVKNAGLMGEVVNGLPIKNVNQDAYNPCVCDTGLGVICPPGKDLYNSMACEYQDSCSCPFGKNKLSNKQPNIPKDCCPPGNKIIFQLPSDSCGTGHKQRAFFNLDSNGVGDIQRDEPGQLVPVNSERYAGVVYDFPSQVIKLRIEKTVEMPGRKSKLEYQFVTPAGNQERVIPINDTRTAQCMSTCDCCVCRKTCHKVG